MPSPVGHALGGLAAGWMIRGNRLAHSGSGRREALLFALLGAAADVDLLFGMHSGPTHGLGAAMFVGASAWLFGRARARRGNSIAPRSFAFGCAAAYASHTLLDWLGTDTSPPIGIMALWPFTRSYYESGLHLFMAISRRVRQPDLFWRQNIVALARELLILAPLVVAVAWLRRVHGMETGAAKQPEN